MADLLEFFKGGTHRSKEGKILVEVRPGVWRYVWPGGKRKR